MRTYVFRINQLIIGRHSFSHVLFGEATSFVSNAKFVSTAKGRRITRLGTGRERSDLPKAGKQAGSLTATDAELFVLFRAVPSGGCRDSSNIVHLIERISAHCRDSSNIVQHLIERISTSGLTAAHGSFWSAKDLDVRGPIPASVRADTSFLALQTGRSVCSAQQS